MNSDLDSREKIVSDRLILYRPSQDDIASIYDIHADPATNHFNPVGPMQSMDEALALFKHWQMEWDEKNWGYWTIALKSKPDRIIGVGGISNRPRFGGSTLVERLKKQNAANMYFRFKPEAWGFGYASEMAKKALDTAFNNIGLDIVLGLTREANIPSRKTLLSLGLSFVEMSDDKHELGPQLIFSIDAKTYAIERKK